MATATVQPISGVTTGTEVEIMTVYPSIGSTGLGQFLGSLYNSIPLGNFPVKLSHLLFTLPTAPLAVLAYFLLKLFGVRYTLTNRSVQIWKSLGNTLIRQINLNDIGDISITQTPGQVFYKCSDLHLEGKDGKPLMTLEGIPRAEVFRQNILEARDAAVRVRASLAAIEARH
ncbi:MAG: hypothetical protein Tsb009_03030 [Planctomycetaceae bacterium]